MEKEARMESLKQAEMLRLIQSGERLFGDSKAIGGIEEGGR